MKKTTLFLILLIDLTLLSSLSGLIAYGFYLLNKPFFPSFLFAFSIIFIVGVLSNNFLRARNERYISEIDNQTAKNIAKNTIAVSCAYCRAENQKIINLNEEMAFNCLSCKQPNKIILNYGAVRVTTPINTELNLNEIISDKEIDKEKIEIL